MLKLPTLPFMWGLGTFRPVKVDNILEHHMHSEFYMVDEEDANLINTCKENGGRIISVGTTSTRTLETVTDEMEWYMKVVDGHRFSFIRDISLRQLIVLLPIFICLNQHLLC